MLFDINASWVVGGTPSRSHDTARLGIVNNIRFSNIEAVYNTWNCDSWVVVVVVVIHLAPQLL